jgi:hypothetical protein
MKSRSILGAIKRAVQVRSRLRVPLFVPIEGRASIQLLVDDGPESFLNDIQRRASLGCGWANAILGYYALMPDANGFRDLERARALCEQPAREGHAYAQYILAWAYMLGGTRHLALVWMGRASAAGFLPAKLDSARFVWKGWGVIEPNCEIAERMCRRAQMDGHKGAMLLRTEMYRQGCFGVGRKVLGEFIAPFVRSYSIIAATIDPFSENVFFVDASMDAALFYS